VIVLLTIANYRDSQFVSPTFQPSLYVYGCLRICKWDVNEIGQIFRRKFEFDYFRKTTQPFLLCFKETIFRLKL